MSRTLTGRNAVAHFVVASHQADGVVLKSHQISKAGSEIRRIFQLRHFAEMRLITHRCGLIEQQVTAERRLFFVLLDVKLVAPSEDAPVKMPWIDARRVLAMLG